MSEDLKEQVVGKLVESVPALLIVLGSFLVLMGVTSGITYHGWLPIVDVAGRIGAVVLGLLLIGLGFYRRVDSQVSDTRRYGIKIENPAPGEKVDDFSVRGTIKKPPPNGYSLKVFRIYPGPDSFIPIGEGRISIADGTWQADRCK